MRLRDRPYHFQQQQQTLSIRFFRHGQNFTQIHRVQVITEGTILRGVEGPKDVGPPAPYGSH